MADILKEGLAKVNPRFKLLVKTLPVQEFYDDVEAHRLPLFIAGYEPDYPDPLSMAMGLLHSGGYYPRAQRFSDRKLDRLIGRAARLTDRKERALLLMQVARRAARDLPQVYTFNPTRFRARRDWVVEDEPLQNVNDLNLDNCPYFYTLSKR
ncbi:MAG: hypothetical protein KGL53_01685, partial [Elusimicrobia bacterium]|nr:hypothetical protein [Elusimicrobiota bacterium]